MKDIDICLLLEGTYPYIRGGVSSWVHQIISGLPQYNFYLVFIGGTRSAYSKIRYELPANVVGMETHFLMDKDDLAVVQRKNHEPARKKSYNFLPLARQGNSKSFAMWQEVLSLFQNNKHTLSKTHLTEILEQLGNKKHLSYEDFLYSEKSWDTLVELYAENAQNQSFVDYFWTFRNIYSPLFRLAHIARNLPKSKILHSISTGYAGFLGALGKQQLNNRFLLTEHGIYTKERKVDLIQTDWIKDRFSALDSSLHRKIEQTRQTWIQFFEQLGRSTYQQADEIIALYEDNQQRQITDGAPPEKTGIIVNGIKVERFEQAYQQRPDTPPKVVGLIGRVVPIKDIKTFIRSIRVTVNTIPDIEGWIVGPTDEDPSYFAECQLLVSSLGLEDHIKFLGMQDVVKIIPQLGACVLTSISEAQPLVLLESMICGIPCIASRVGSCNEIINGMSEEDKALGSCGYIVGIASPNQTAEAIEKLFSDAENWRKMGDVGRTRVQQFYLESTMYERYNTLYQELLTWQE